MVAPDFRSVFPLGMQACPSLIFQEQMKTLLLHWLFEKEEVLTVGHFEIFVCCLNHLVNTVSFSVERLSV